ncbi:hypothetical protein DFP72DRAFT_1057071 [Ephemerocybe angulata]|uniref:Uncharacterized protein n=1 Tax=Ephemerocybe angulata TaxID=980116 RepID=A0A8H6H6F2_9AGAR|nr:hypothetical protein DFP72DRAFT_1057071 [Tulosesus angulatus]
MNWTTPDHVEYLSQFLPEFKRLKGSKQPLNEFWTKVTHGFFLKWTKQSDEIRPPPKPPALNKSGKKSLREPPPPPEVTIYESDKQWSDARSRQIHSWFYNHTSDSRKHKKAKVNIVVAVGKKDRVLTEDQLYSKKYYQARVKPKVDEALEGMDDSDQRIATTSRIVRESLANETSAIREEIRREHEKLVQAKKASDTTMKKVLGNDEPVINPEELAITQAAVPELLESFCQTMAAKTGWAFTVLAGGPMVSMPNAPVRVCTYHVGTLSGSNTFRAWHPAFDQSVATPFSSFCHTIFPEADRLRHAIEIELGKLTSPEALLESGRVVGRLAYRGMVPPGVQAMGKGSEDAEGGTSDEEDEVQAPTRTKKKGKKGQKGRKGKKVQSESEDTEDGEKARDKATKGKNRKKGKPKKTKGKRRGRDSRSESEDSDSDTSTEEESEEEVVVAPKPTAKKAKGRGKAKAKASKKGGKGKDVQGVEEDQEPGTANPGEFNDFGGMPEPDWDAVAAIGRGPQQAWPEGTDLFAQMQQQHMEDSFDRENAGRDMGGMGGGGTGGMSGSSPIWCGRERERHIRIWTGRPFQFRPRGVRDARPTRDARYARHRELRCRPKWSGGEAAKC